MGEIQVQEKKQTMEYVEFIRKLYQDGIRDFAYSIEYSAEGPISGIVPERPHHSHYKISWSIKVQPFKDNKQLTPWKKSDTYYIGGQEVPEEVALFESSLESLPLFFPGIQIRKTVEK